MLNQLKNPLDLVGRILIALLFLPAGIQKISGFAGTVGYAASAGMPMPQIAVGVGLVIALGGFLVTMRVGASAQQARALAEQAVGEGYRFHITWLSRVRTGTATQVTAVVTAWNDSEVRRIPVQWESP